MIRAETLKRLAAMDAALAGDGLRRTEMAERFGVSHKTIARDHEVLRLISGDDGVYARDRDDGHYRWWYADRRHRVFSARIVRRYG